MRLTSREWRGLLALSGELAEIVEHDAAAAAAHALASLHALAGADEGFVVFSALTEPAAAATDPFGGWRPVHTLFDHRPEERARLVAEWFAEPGRLLRDPTTQRLARSCGRPRAFLRREIAHGLRPAEQTDLELLEALRVRDRLCGGVGITETLDVIVGLDRSIGARPFGVRQRELSRAAAVHLHWFFHRLAAGLGLTADAPWRRLSPREKATFRGLVTGRTEKAIARDLGISHLTLHQYVMGVYRKLDVSSRGELLARYAKAPLAALHEVHRIAYAAPRRLSMPLSSLEPLPDDPF